MDPTHDIYREQEKGFLFSRRRKHRRMHAAEAASGSAPLPGLTPVPGVVVVEPGSGGGPAPQLHRRRRRRRHARNSSGSDKSKLVWFLLLGVLLIYGAFLLATLLHERKRSRTAVARAAAEAQLVAKEEAVTVHAPVMEALRRWKRAPQVFQEVQGLLEKKDFPQARQRLKQLRQEKFEAVDLLHLQAQLDWREHRLEEARALLVRVLEAEPGHAAARLLLAQTLEALHDYPNAGALAEWILESNPDLILAHQIAANSYLQTAQPRLALPFLKKITLLLPVNAAAKNNLAEAHMQLKEYDRAQELYRKALAEEPASAITYYNLAVCLVKQNKAEEVGDLLTQAMAACGPWVVKAWLQSAAFNTIRSHPRFQLLQRDVAAATVNSPEGPAKVLQVRLPDDGLEAVERVNRAAPLADLKLQR